ncbi:unnamed protein product, partial [Amoebophrya sp. A25]
QHVGRNAAAEAESGGVATDPKIAAAEAAAEQEMQGATETDAGQLKAAAKAATGQADGEVEAGVPPAIAAAEAAAPEASAEAMA